MTSDTAPAWDGVPLNPERDGWHWLQWNVSAQSKYQFQRAPMAMLWNAGEIPKHWDSTRLDYLGPCHTPAEVAALVEAARREEREACAVIAYAELNAATTEGEQDIVGNVIDAIRARSTEEARHDAR